MLLSTVLRNAMVNVYTAYGLGPGVVGFGGGAAYAGTVPATGDSALPGDAVLVAQWNNTGQLVWSAASGGGAQVVVPSASDPCLASGLLITYFMMGFGGTGTGGANPNIGAYCTVGQGATANADVCLDTLTPSAVGQIINIVACKLTVPPAK